MFFSDGAWSADAQKATLFDMALNAWRLCQEQRLVGVELVLLFEGEPRGVLEGREGVVVS